LPDHRSLTAYLTREESHQLDLKVNQTVFVRPKAARAQAFAYS
jgi:hypothetical protein